jgi:hypothetical protein
MKSKIPFILVLIGDILGFLGSLYSIGTYFLFTSMEDEFGQIYQMMGFNFKALMLLSLVAAVFGLLLSLCLIYYVVRINKTPTRTDFIVTAILGGIGVFTMGLGGILVLVGGIVGVVKLEKEGA